MMRLLWNHSDNSHSKRHSVCRMVVCTSYQKNLPDIRIRMNQIWKVDLSKWGLEIKQKGAVHWNWQGRGPEELYGSSKMDRKLVEWEKRMKRRWTQICLWRLLMRTAGNKENDSWKQAVETLIHLLPPIPYRVSRADWVLMPRRTILRVPSDTSSRSSTSTVNNVSGVTLLPPKELDGLPEVLPYFCGFQICCTSGLLVPISCLRTPQIQRSSIGFVLQLTSGVHHRVWRVPQQALEILWPQFRTAALTVEAWSTLASLRSSWNHPWQASTACSQKTQHVWDHQVFPASYHPWIEFTTSFSSIDSSAPLFTQGSSSYDRRSDGTITKSIIAL